MSFVAINRLIEERAAANQGYRRALKRSGKPLLSHARTLTDEQLLDKLRRVGIELSEASFAEVAEHAMSAEEIAKTAITADVQERFETPADEDWVWLALTILWERWYPEWPNLEQLDDRMQAGYALSGSDPVGTCEQWFEAWKDFLILYDMGSFKSIDDFDGAFGGTQFVSNWVGDLDMELANAAVEDPRWHERRLQFASEFLRRFPNEPDLTRENIRRALAEATFGLGDHAGGDELYRQWLKDDPRWGWGWIGWSDAHSGLGEDTARDPRRAEELLKQGLAVPGIRDREDLLERLALLCSDQGRDEEAATLQAESRAVRRSVTRTGNRTLSVKTALDVGEEGLPLDQLPNLAAELRREHERILGAAMPARVKIGRNAPCPCGSGKKYKKCCGGS